MNHIPRSFKTIIGTFKSGNLKGVRVTITKDAFGYHADTGSATYCVFPSHLRIAELFEIEEINY